MRYDTTFPFSIRFDFKKAHPLTRIRLVYSGHLPSVFAAASADGKTWSKLASSAAEPEPTEDVHEKLFEGDWGPGRFVRIDFWERQEGAALTLSEIEVWSK